MVDAPAVDSRCSTPGAVEHRPQFEVIPLPGALEAVIAHLPPGARVSVTSSPTQGQEASLTLAAELARAGFTAIPHLAARRIHGAAQAREMSAWMEEAGIREAFAIAGDPALPAGDLAGSLDLLEALHAQSPHLVAGVAGYPEGHPHAEPDAELDLLRRKAEHASYVVTQMCFTARPVIDWVRRAREAGVGLPVRPGVAGPVDLARLLRIGSRVGVGPSLSVLRRHGAGMRRLVRPGTWSPEPLLADLARDARAAGLELAAPHVYTFNALELTGAHWGAAPQTGSRPADL